MNACKRASLVTNALLQIPVSAKAIHLVVDKRFIKQIRRFFSRHRKANSVCNALS